MSRLFEKIEIPEIDLSETEKAIKNIWAEIDRIAKDIQEQKDNAMAMEFTKCIGELLRKNGVTPKITEYTRDFETDNTFETRYGVSIDELDFSEHDKVFEDKIAKLESEISYLRNTVTQYKEDCVKLEEKLESRKKINLNDRVKVKLTPLGAEIYYHQFDDVDKKIKENGGTGFEPMMPQIDKDGYTEIQLWHFMELYGEHIGMCKPNVINPLNIVIAE